MIRPTWDFGDFHRNEWVKKDITVIVCERDTADITRLCLESLLRFYPDIPILIIDGGSIDGPPQQPGIDPDGWEWKLVGVGDLPE